MTPATPEPAALADRAVLALLAEGPAHGWAIVRAMGPDGEVGRIWTCSRAGVYRSLETLGEAGLVRAADVAPGARGPQRRLMEVTQAGRDAIGAWLGEPVRHVRDLRSELLLKLFFLSRAGADPWPLLTAQRAALTPVIDHQAAAAEAGEGFERVVALWRLETSRAARVFVDRLLRDPGP